jgi:hypothetical protein
MGRIMLLGVALVGIGVIALLLARRRRNAKHPTAP